MPDKEPAYEVNARRNDGLRTWIAIKKAITKPYNTSKKPTNSICFPVHCMCHFFMCYLFIKKLGIYRWFPYIP